MKKNKSVSIKLIIFALIVFCTTLLPKQRIEAKEFDSDINVVVSNKITNDSNQGIQPLTVLMDCEIIMAFTTDGLEMQFTTVSMDLASVIGVKDIKVQQKMWYGWKTVWTSEGAESKNRSVFGLEQTYPDAVNGKTYRVICTHYADYDGYEEVVNDTGAFKFVL